MRQITESESNPKADGFYMPAEYAPQDRVYMGWPNRPDTFAFGAVPAQRTYAGIANAISEFTPVVMCCNEADYANCKAVFKDNERVTVNGRVQRASYDVKVGDVISIRFGQNTLTVEVLSVTENVGKDAAAAMYREAAPQPDKLS